MRVQFGIILKKMRLNRLVYRILKHIVTPEKNKCNKFSQEEISNAIKKLNSFHQDVHSSCLTNNTIQKKYDLQIIVPVYNVERFIVDCIESVLNQQTKYSYCLTIINDGSPDNSRQLLKKYENLNLSNHLVEIIDQKNKGLSGARNAGLTTIKGKYITFLDSDDRLHPGAIDAFMNAAIKYNADIVQGGYLSISLKGSVRKRYPSTFKISSSDDDHLLGFICSKAYRAELFEHIHFPERYWFEDTICAYMLFQLAAIRVSIEQYVYEYRRNESSITFTSRGSNKSLDTAYITESLIKDAMHFDYFDSQKFYARQFQQIKGNCVRLFALKNPEIEKAVFLFHCYLIENYFNSKELESGDYAQTEMYQAILSHNYKLYRLISYLL